MSPQKAKAEVPRSSGSRYMGRIDDKLLRIRALQRGDKGIEGTLQYHRVLGLLPNPKAQAGSKDYPEIALEKQRIGG